MKAVSYVDSDGVKNVLIYEADLIDFRLRLQDEGYLIIGEEKVPATKARGTGRYPKPEENERR